MDNRAERREHPDMLNAAIVVIEASTDPPDAFIDCEGEKSREPVRCCRNGIVVQKYNLFITRFAPQLVHFARIIEPLSLCARRFYSFQPEGPWPPRPIRITHDIVAHDHRDA